MEGAMAESDKTPRRSAKKARCAIYTRKSSEEGLEQAFNSLDAKSAQSGGMEKNGQRERILGLCRRVAVRRFMCEGPCLLGIFPRL
jgi:hypothetical protein